MSSSSNRREDDEVVLPRPAPARSEGRQRLAAAVTRLPAPAFAVVDGGHFDDLPSALSGAGLFARSLFLGDGRRDVQRHGPWLVALGQRPDTIGTILDLIGDSPAALFWACGSGEQALWRHLRTLNQARVAKPESNAAVEGMSGLPSDPAASGSEVVLFRHWDPRVLSVVMPVLDGGQYARVLGPSDEAVFLDPERSGGVGLRRLKRFPDLPPASRGMLALNADQISAVDESMQERSQRKTAVYLREVAPNVAGALSHADLHDRIRAYGESGQALGLSGERAQMKWAYLMLVTQERAAAMPDVTGFIRSGRRSPDDQVDETMRLLIGVARARDGQAS